MKAQPHPYLSSSKGEAAPQWPSYHPSAPTLSPLPVERYLNFPLVQPLSKTKL